MKARKSRFPSFLTLDAMAGRLGTGMAILHADICWRLSADTGRSAELARQRQGRQKKRNLCNALRIGITTIGAEWKYGLSKAEDNTPFPR